MSHLQWQLTETTGRVRNRLWRLAEPAKRIGGAFIMPSDPGRDFAKSEQDAIQLTRELREKHGWAPSKIAVELKRRGYRRSDDEPWPQEAVAEIVRAFDKERDRESTVACLLSLGIPLLVVVASAILIVYGSHRLAPELRWTWTVAGLGSLVAAIIIIGKLLQCRNAGETVLCLSFVIGVIPIGVLLTATVLANSEGISYSQALAWSLLSSVPALLARRRDGSFSVPPWLVAIMVVHAVGFLVTVADAHPESESTQSAGLLTVSLPATAAMSFCGFAAAFFAHLLGARPDVQDTIFTTHTEEPTQTKPKVGRFARQKPTDGAAEFLRRLEVEDTQAEDSPRD